MYSTTSGSSSSRTSSSPSTSSSTIFSMLTPPTLELFFLVLLLRRNLKDKTRQNLLLRHLVIFYILMNLSIKQNFHHLPIKFNFRRRVVFSFYINTSQFLVVCDLHKNSLYNKETPQCTLLTIQSDCL